MNKDYTKEAKEFLNSIPKEYESDILVATPELLSDFTQQEVKKAVEKLQFELKAADKENERLTKENKELNKDLNLKIKQRQNWYESYHEKSEQLQQKETELKELKEGIELLKIYDRGMMLTKAIEALLTK